MGEEVIMGDLFCGRGGWTKGFMAHGWDCWGIDLNPQPLYPGRFIQADIAHLIELPYADFYCCSSPCEGFSVFGMRHFHKNPKWPWLGIALFRRAQELLEATGKPYVMENVRVAERFLGRSINHCGPFYLWGSAVPAIFPRDAYKVTKGMKVSALYFGGTGQMQRTLPISEIRRLRREARKAQGIRNVGEDGSNGAVAAEIPHEIAAYVASIQF